MNHLGDTNKMVVEDVSNEQMTAQATPNEELRRQILSHCVAKNEREWWASRTIEKLERELNAANDRIQSLIEERDRANRLAEWKWNLRDEFQLLLGTDKIEEGIEMSNQNDGGPAYPSHQACASWQCRKPSSGMTMRDYFAAAALEKASRGSDRNADEIAKRAFYIADAMLKAREVKP